MEELKIIMWLVLILYNAATIKLLIYALGHVDVAEAVKEKSSESSPSASRMAAAAPGAVVAPGPADTSYSRVAGLVGAVVLATFFWALGNVVVYKAFVAPGDIEKLVSSLGTYFLGGASLFLPYAFNQLRDHSGGNNIR